MKKEDIAKKMKSKRKECINCDSDKHSYKDCPQLK